MRSAFGVVAASRWSSRRSWPLLIEPCAQLSSARSRREVLAAEEALERQKNEVGHLVEQLCEAEQQRDEYKENVAKLSAQLGRAEKDRTKLQARLEETEHLLQRLSF